MQIYLVGGAVRDAMLGLPVYERDYVVVGSTPEALLQQGFVAVGKDFPVFLHPETQEEYALARTERKSGKGYTGFECHASPDVTLEQDLARRDLTINAIAQTESGEIIDPYHGARDIERRVLRHVSAAFVEDPLRVLRVARFAARFAPLGFTIAEETKQLMKAVVASGEIQHLVAERVWQETHKALMCEQPQVYFQVLHECGALEALLKLKIHPCSSWPSLTQVSARTVLDTSRYAAWVHDLGQAHGSLSNAIAQCEQHIRAPNAMRDMVRILYRTLVLLEQPIITTDHALAFYQRIDLWRKQERATELMQLMSWLQSEHQTRIEALFAPMASLRAIEVQDLVQQGFKGAAIGEQLQRRRAIQLEQHWGSAHI